MHLKGLSHHLSMVVPREGRKSLLINDSHLLKRGAYNEGDPSTESKGPLLWGLPLGGPYRATWLS